MPTVHDGHRERVKEQFAVYGGESMTDIQYFEMLLFYAIPRRDTNELAHALLERFGSLRAVLDADPAELRSVKGIGENAALLIKTVREGMRRYMVEPNREIRYIFSSSDAGRYFLPILQYETIEKAYLMCLDKNDAIISCTEISSGIQGAVNVTIRQIVDTAVRRCAAKVILAHNHPSGNPYPSAEDKLLTDSLKKALRLMEIKLRDHILVAGKTYVSFAQFGFL